MKIRKADFIKSAVYEKDYPEQLDKIEFAFVGRSNVGKSSLINSLTSRLKLARTSKTPGRTQLINYFLINDEFYIVDLPGYGFAKVPKEMKKQWGQTMERYIASKRKKLVFVLLDITFRRHLEEIQESGMECRCFNVLFPGDMSLLGEEADEAKRDQYLQT